MLDILWNLQLQELTKVSNQYIYQGLNASPAYQGTTSICGTLISRININTKIITLVNKCALVYCYADLEGEKICHLSENRDA